MKIFIKLLILFLPISAYSQNRNSNWCLGDSTGVYFGVGNPTLFTAALKTRGSCISVSDSIGQLLYYAYTRATVIGNSTRIINKDDLLMSNGGSVVGEGWYQELITIAIPSTSDLYYLFSVGVTGSSQFGLYYSIIDMNLDIGRGAITQKNVQLQNYLADDCVQAIKHGNGRDWWVLSRWAGSSNNDFYKYLITPTGIGPAIIQSVGSNTTTNSFRFVFSKDGAKMASITLGGLLELYDFDRCSGVITFDQNIHVEGAPNPYFWGVEFSPNGRYLYVTAEGDGSVSYLIQFDLQAPYIYNSGDTLWTYSTTTYAIGAIKRGPDDKLYVTSAWFDGMNFNYPYPDSVFNIVNNNLSVINYPDSPGVACGFTPFSFNLGAGRCYWGLPNNPDYELGPDTNSLCDTVLSVDSRPLTVDGNSQLHVFYHPGWQIAFINAEGLTGKNYNLQVYDLFGRIIFTEEGCLNSAYFTKDLNCVGFAKGMYVVTLRTENEVVGKKFIKE